MPPADWDSVIVATGPLTSPALAEAISDADRRGRARLLRRHRADRPPRHHRHVGRLAAIALRQGGPRWIGRRLHQLPAHARAIRGLRGRAARRRQSRLPRLGSDDALFRRLPADRGDGRARARDAPSRPDEAVRPHQSAPAGGRSLTPSCSCARTIGSARCSTWWASRPSSSMASRRASSARFRAWSRRSSRGSAGFIAIPSSTRRNCSTARCGCGAQPRLRFAGQITGCEGYVESAAIGLLAGRFAAAERLGERLMPPPPTTAHGALLAHITGGHVETVSSGAGRTLVPADERQFRPVSAARAARSRAPQASGCAAPPRRWQRNRRSAGARSPISSTGSPATGHAAAAE